MQALRETSVLLGLAPSIPAALDTAAALHVLCCGVGWDNVNKQGPLPPHPPPPKPQTFSDTCYPPPKNIELSLFQTVEKEERRCGGGWGGEGGGRQRPTTFTASYQTLAAPLIVSSPETPTSGRWSLTFLHPKVCLQSNGTERPRCAYNFI